MEYWSHIYEHFNLVAFNIFSIPVHWYILALLSALMIAKWIVEKDNIDIRQKSTPSFRRSK